MTTTTPYLWLRGRVGNLVYQRTAPGHGNVADDPTHTLQVRRYVPHNASASPAQLACRAKFRAGMIEYHNLPQQQKDDLNTYGARSGHSGVNVFMSIKLRS